MKFREYVYLITFLLSISCFCYSNILFQEMNDLKKDGVSWHCKKCKRQIWKQNPPYICNTCGTPRG